MDLNGDMDDREDAIDDIDGLLYEQFRDVAQEENGVGEGPNEDAKMFYNLLEDAKAELYPGCKNFTKLSFTIRLYLLKYLYGWSNASFNALLVLLRESMPQLNIPDSLNKTRGMIRDLGLDYKKIDAFPNDCMLYSKDHENDTSCHVCGAPRWIENVEGDRQLEENKKAYKISGKVLRRFPLIPRLQRLFLCSKTAGSLRWHEEERSKDGKLRHPADGEAWKDFDKCHPNFASDSRNIRLGLTNNGFNPFRSMNVSHKTRLNRMTRNSDRCDPCEVGIGHSIGSAKVISLEYKLRSQAHHYILFNHDEVQEFIREHENVITNVKKRKKWSKAKSQGQDFVEWFKNRALMDDVPDHLKELSRGPNTIARCFSSYAINGYRFHTKQHDATRKARNNVEDDKYGLTCAYFNKRCYVDDPFVLASQVHQCFYIEDPFDDNRKYVMKTVPRDFFNMKDDINSNAQELYQSEPSDHAVNLAIVDSNYEVELVRDDMPTTVIENPLLKSNMVESEDELDFDATLSESMD
ncbi:hypothetical protein ZIOFF_056110 [Zingiber officinale]|uniref:DUF4216 domain-containing protein n=1 Tax=Zingiber officinale TaxID=94328 RepID=A0A8J5FNA7_ZINOF|nr:hypothetical protein ZIOFF_056110 [Zingiber officinale]